MTLAAWLHTLSPVVWHIYGALSIRWYGVAYLAGFAVGYFVLLKLAKRRLVAIPYDRVGDAIMWLVLGVLIGGRLGYVLVYDPHQWLSFSRSFPFWGVLAIHHGGMASHGGMVGVVIAAWRISRGFRNPQTGAIEGRCPPLHIMDVGALVCPFGLFFGRIANFVNGELLGRVVSRPGFPGPWWSVQYPQELRGITQVFPSGQIEYHDPAQALTPEQGRELYSLLHQIGTPDDPVSTKIDYLVDHAREFASPLKSLLASRHPSQIYQAVAEGIVLGVALWLLWYKPRKPGFIGAWFLIIYGVLRIATEFIRLPDPQFVHGRYFGLSRGQWLSAAMVAAGSLVLLYVKKSNAPRLGGWGSKPVSPSA